MKKKTLLIKLIRTEKPINLTELGSLFSYMLERKVLFYVWQCSVFSFFWSDLRDCSQTQVRSAERVLASTYQNLRCGYSKFWRAPALLNKSQDFAFSRALLKCREGTEWLNDHPHKYDKWSQCLKLVQVHSTTTLCNMLSIF